MDRSNCCSTALGGGWFGGILGSLELSSFVSSFGASLDSSSFWNDDDVDDNLYIIGGMFCTSACNSLARCVMCSTVSLDDTNSRYRDDNTKRNSVRLASASYNALACKARISSILILCFKCCVNTVGVVLVLLLLLLLLVGTDDVVDDIDDATAAADV
jgi:ABC-type xylose transport system permease subunit